MLHRSAMFLDTQVFGTKATSSRNDSGSRVKSRYNWSRFLSWSWSSDISTLSLSSSSVTGLNGSIWHSSWQSAVPADGFLLQMHAEMRDATKMLTMVISMMVVRKGNRCCLWPSSRILSHGRCSKLGRPIMGSPTSILSSRAEVEPKQAPNWFTFSCR